MNKDTNFDDLAGHFKKKIYGSLKGKIRLAVLKRDLKLCLPQLEHGSLNVLDIGAGIAQMGLYLASMGHNVCINDISENMLNLAKEEAKQYSDINVAWHHGPFQTLPAAKYDLVLCHAVLEWLDDPKSLVQVLESQLADKGTVSLMFYNYDALVMHNLVRGNFNKINSDNLSGMKGGLTPPNPLKLAWVEKYLKQEGFDLFYKSGVRVFSDYVGVKRGGNESENAVLDMELKYSNQEPYLQMGRYIHLLCRRVR